VGKCNPKLENLKSRKGGHLKDAPISDFSETYKKGFVECFKPVPIA